MREYGFSLTRIMPYKDRIYDSALIPENTGQQKPLFSHILCIDWRWKSNIDDNELFQ